MFHLPQITCRGLFAKFATLKDGIKYKGRNFIKLRIVIIHSKAYRKKSILGVPKVDKKSNFEAKKSIKDDKKCRSGGLILRGARL